MNERIKQLQFQAAAQVSPLKEGAEWQKDFVESFAQLLIDECIQVAMNAKSQEAAALIVMHFGDKNAIE